LKDIHNIALLLLSTNFCDLGETKINKILIKQGSRMYSAVKKKQIVFLHFLLQSVCVGGMTSVSQDKDARYKFVRF